MSTHSLSKSPFTQFEIHKITTTDKHRHSDSPTSSILKTPTAIFVSSRSSSTKRLKFANGPLDLQTLKNDSNEANVDYATPQNHKANGNGEIISSDTKIKVAISPVKTMQVSPESWEAFLAYKKYNDYANETEKTDYTYSRLSKCRREIIPGFLVRPNLSRSSISSSRKSTSSLPCQSSFNESYLSYDFKVDSSPRSDFNYDHKTPDLSSKSFHSKYNLRSSGLGDIDINSKHNYSTGEIHHGKFSKKQSHIEKDYFSDSVEPEKIIKKTTYYCTTTPGGQNTSKYLTKVRSLDLDDADIDEVDDNEVNHNKHYYRRTWFQNGSQVQNSNIFGRFFTAALLYLTTLRNNTWDLFSKYVLRKKDQHGLGYSAVSGSGISWTSDKQYTSPQYYTGGYYDLNQSWYQRLVSYFTDKYSQLSNFFLGNSTRYVSYSQQRDSSRRKLWWWLLLPLLILAGFWLLRGNESGDFVSHQYKALDCKTNGFLTSLENLIRSAWKSVYFAYKRAEASASCYMNDSWERLKLPFEHFSDWLNGRLPIVFRTLWAPITNIWTSLWRGTLAVFTISRDAFLNLGLFLTRFLTYRVGNVLNYVCQCLNSIYFTSADSLAWLYRVLKSIVLNVGSYIYLLMFAPRQTEKVSAFSREASCNQQVIDKLSSEIEDFKSVMMELSNIKKKVDDLELTLRKERETIQNENEVYNKQMAENHLILQKYQAAINRALMSSKRPGQVSDSVMQYFLDNHTNELKEWIMHNFLLKADAMSNFDESKMALLIAKYSNKSTGDLFALQEEFRRFIAHHKSDLEALRKDISSLATHPVEGGDVSVAYIKKIVGDAIKLYDADKTGRADYALETAGGQVHSIRCTETYLASPRSYILLGWAVYTKASSPRDAITPGMAAGQCWAFVGSQGFLVLQLSHTIEVTGFTMEHISRLLVAKGHIESAPKNFSMWGLKNEFDVEPHLFGEYTYLDNDETLQHFPVKYPSLNTYNMVELKITSNHGNPNYTCLYRIRVHGELRPIKF